MHNHYYLSKLSLKSKLGLKIKKINLSHSKIIPLQFSFIPLYLSEERKYPSFCTVERKEEPQRDALHHQAQKFLYYFDYTRNLIFAHLT